MEGVIKVSISTINREYQAIRKLGQGLCGVVYSYRRRGTQQQYALKMINTTNQHIRNDSLNQIQIISHLDHPCIIQIFKYYHETFRDQNDKRYEVGLLLQRGIKSLQQCLKDRSSYHYDFQDIIRFIVKFIELGAYLQSKKIVHRDIKPGNIIIFGPRLEFKLADFGLSCHAERLPTGYAGTPGFLSPALEKFRKCGDHSMRTNSNPYKDDVYSFGITSEQVIKYRYDFKECPREIKILIEEMLRENQNHRPSFTSLLHHEIVQNHLRNSQQTHENLHISEVPSQLPSNNQKMIEARQQIEEGSPCTKKKIIQKEVQPSESEHHTQKSRRVKGQRSFGGFCKGVRTMCHVGQFLLLGTQSGEVHMLNCSNGSAALVSLSHEGYIAKITIDLRGFVWIAGGDGRIDIIHRDVLANCFEAREPTVASRVSFLGEHRQVHSSTARIPTSELRQLYFNEHTISQVVCIDIQHYAVGFCSGAICVRWGDQEERGYQIHSQPITCLRVREGRLFSGDFSGMIKTYSLGKRIIEKGFHKLSGELLGFTVSEAQEGQKIEGSTCRGQIQTISIFKDSVTVFNAEIPSQNVIAIAPEHSYLLTLDGQVYSMGNFFIKVEGQQLEWICIEETENDQLILACREGEICVITLEKSLF